MLYALRGSFPPHACLQVMPMSVRSCQVAGTVGSAVIVLVVVLVVVKLYWKRTTPPRAVKHRVIVLSPPAAYAVVDVTRDVARDPTIHTSDDPGRRRNRWATPGSTSMMARGRPDYHHRRYLQGGKRGLDVYHT